MKKILIIFVAICFVFMINSLMNGENNKNEDIEVVGELLESIEDNDYKTMVCSKKDANLFSEQKIKINFDINNIVDSVIVEEKYSNREMASAAYDRILSDEKNEEVVLDGLSLTYDTTKTFGYEGMSKEEIVEIMNEYKNDGINTGYVITWE